MGLRITAATLLLAWSWQTASGQSVLWDKRPGLVIDISGNSNGAFWALGIERVNESGYKVFRFDEIDWVRDYNAPPGRRVAVGPEGDIWILDDLNNIHRYTAGSVQSLGQAHDIAVGADGSVWIIGMPEVAGGFRIYKWSGSGWTNFAGGAVRIAVEPDGTPWVVNAAGDIFRFNAAANRFEHKPGKAHSVHAGASGAVWMLGTDPIVGGYPIYLWNAGKQDWDAYGSYGAVDITEVAGRPWIVQDDGSTFSKSLLTIIDPIPIEFTPTAPVWPPMTPQAEPPVLVETAGKMLCAAADSGSWTYCGDTNADYVGGYTLDTTCDEGFYDMIHGGTCWKCPDDTDGRGAWIRSADHIESDTACWRIPAEITGKAILVKMPARSTECTNGSFYDPYSEDDSYGRIPNPRGDGSCWKCPASLPRRTWAPVWADNACATPLNETQPATLLSFNGCPEPDAATMNLPGKRSPGKPFLDIAAGAGNGYAAGCFACPVTDEQGNILLTDRNANPLYDKSNNNGCRILMKWQPPRFPEPGLAYMQGVKDVIWDRRLFDDGRITGFLYDMAEAQGFGDATPEAKAWVEARWQEIAAKPYNSESFRAFMFAILRSAAQKTAAARTPGEQKLIQSFESYIQERRTYLAEQALAMYDAWKAFNDLYRAQTGQTKSLGQLFYYGTVPLDFHKTVGSLMGLGGAGASMAGAMVAFNQFSYHTFFLKTIDAGRAFYRAQESVAYLNTGLNLLKSPQGLTLLSGASAVSAVGAILLSIAVDQFVTIQNARPKLEASLAEAKKPVDLNVLARGKHGEDMLYFYWAKAMDTAGVEDPQVVQLAAQARARARQGGYQPPPKQEIEVTLEWNNAGSAVSSGSGAPSPFESPGLMQYQMLVSPNGKYQAKMQTDGNFVIYEENTPIWNTNTVGKAEEPYRLAMQPDGNLVVYGSSKADVFLPGLWVCRANSPCLPIWSTGPRGGRSYGTGPYTLQMQDDGNLVLVDSTGLPLWASGTQR
jgi:hypothetical protein